MQSNEQQNLAKMRDKLKKADSYLHDTNTPKAISLYKSIIEEYLVKIDEPILGLGSIADQKGYYEKHIIEWHQEIKQQQQSISAYDSLSICYSINKSYTEGEEYYKSMLQKYPDNACLRFGLGNIYFNCGSLDKAKTEYLKIIAQTSENFQYVIRQLIMIAFYEGNHKQVREYLNRIKNIEKDNVLKLIDAFIQPSYDEKIKKIDEIIAEDIPNFARPYLFKGYLLQKNKQESQAIAVYQQCIKYSQKYTLPAVEIANINVAKHNDKAAIKLLEKARIFKWDDQSLIDFYLAFLYIRNKQDQKAQKSLAEVAKQIDLSYLALKPSNSAFLKRQVEKLINLSQKIKNQNIDSIEKWKELKRVQNFIVNLNSIKQEHLNIRIERIIKKDIQLLQFINKTLEKDFQFNEQFLKQIKMLSVDFNLLVQILISAVNRYISKALGKKEKSFEEISQYIESVLNNFDFESDVEENLSESEQFLDKNNKLYTINYTDRNFNALGDKKQFNSYDHLYKTLRKFSKDVRSINSAAQTIIQKVLSKETPLMCDIHHKIDFDNIQASIDQLLVDFLPEMEKKREEISQTIQKVFAENIDHSREAVAEKVKQTVQNLLDDSIKNLRDKKVPIILNIEDWIQVDFFFDHQKSIINAIELIQSECSENKYEILNVEGKFQKKESGSGIFLIIRIRNVCCKFNFYFERKYEESLFKKYILKFINFKFGSSLNGIIESNKFHKESLSSHLSELIHCLKKDDSLQSELNLNFANIESFMNEIEVKDHQDSKSHFSYQKQTFDVDYLTPTEKGKNIRTKTLSHSMIVDLNVSPSEQKNTHRSNKKSQNGSDDFQLLNNLKSKLKKRVDKKGEGQDEKQVRFSTQQNEQEKHYSSRRLTFSPSVDNILSINEHPMKRKALAIQKSMDVSLNVQNFQQNKRMLEKLTAQNKELNNKNNLLEEEKQEQQLEHRKVLCQLDTLREKQKLKQETIQAKTIQLENLLKQLHNLKTQNRNLERQKKNEIKKNEKSTLQLQNQLEELQNLKRAEKFTNEVKESLEHDIKQMKQNENKLAEERRMKKDLEKRLAQLEQEKVLKEVEFNKLKEAEIKLLNELQNKQKSQQKLKRSLNKHKTSEQMLQKELQFMKRQKQQKQSQNETLALKIESVESKLQSIGKDIKEYSATRSKKEDSEKKTAQIRRQRQTAPESPPSKQIQRKLFQKAEDEQIQKECELCEGERQKVWKSKRTLKYVTIIFLLMLFEAITFTFSVHIFK